MVPVSDALFKLRATRADPPSLAKGERRPTYGAALTQFDELITAAEASGPASRGLPLFYALSQAGRAIAAAFLDDPWRLRGHGLSAPDLAYDVLDVPVEVAGSQNRDGTWRSFGGVAKATGSPVPDKPVTLRDLWASLPEAFELLTERPDVVPLLLVPTVPGTPYDWGKAQATVVGFGGRPEELKQHLEAHFQSAEGVELMHTDIPPRARSVITQHGVGVGVWWSSSDNIGNHIARLEEVAPAGRTLEPRWLRPAVCDVALSPLMTWWMLLFGLSMLARYEPDVWVDALQYDSSSVAAALDELLELGCDRVPELVLDGVNSRPTARVEQ